MKFAEKNDPLNPKAIRFEDLLTQLKRTKTYADAKKLLDDRGIDNPKDHFIVYDARRIIDLLERRKESDELRKIENKRRAEWHRLHGKGHTYEQIAKQYDVSVSTVRREIRGKR